MKETTKIYTTSKIMKNSDRRSIVIDGDYDINTRNKNKLAILGSHLHKVKAIPFYNEIPVDVTRCQTIVK